MTTLQVWDADGSAAVSVDSCAGGCVPAAGPVAAHCGYIAPIWMPDICDMPATDAMFMPKASATYDANLDTNCTGGLVTQPIGRPICVVRAKTITIPAGI